MGKDIIFMYDHIYQIKKYYENKNINKKFFFKHRILSMHYI